MLLDYIKRTKQLYRFLKAKETITLNWSQVALDQAKEFRSVVAPKKVSNVPLVRIGGDRDGGYVFLDPGRDGIAYSFGVSCRSPWDLEMAERGFRVFQYDGTVEKEPDVHPNIFFHKYNIDASSTPPSDCKNFAQIIQDHGHEDENDIILQIDIESAEWAFFENLTTEQLMKFKQIIVEFHGLCPGHADFKNKLAVLHKLRRTHTPVHIHGNNCGTVMCCQGTTLVPITAEISYARSGLAKDGFRFVKEKGYYPKPIDKPNNHKFPDIPLGCFHRHSEEG